MAAEGEGEEEILGSIAVHHLGRDRFGVRIRGHELVSDQPREDGGEDTGPTPTELFIAGLAACVGGLRGPLP
jgi:putative redox protein